MELDPKDKVQEQEEEEPIHLDREDLVALLSVSALIVDTNNFILEESPALQ
jgi:hypothetical protein